MFAGTSVGQRLRASMGDDAWARLPGKAIPGAKEQLASETSLMLSRAKAEGKAGTNKHRLDTIVAAAGGADSPRGQFYAQKFAGATDEDLKYAEDLLKQDRAQEFHQSYPRRRPHRRRPSRREGPRGSNRRHRQGRQRGRGLRD